MEKTRPSVRRQRIYPVLAAVLAVTITAFGYYHIVTYSDFWTTQIFVALFIYMTWLVLSAHVNRTFDCDSCTEDLKPIVVMPVYNEDPEILEESLRSVLGQTRRPRMVYVIDDGSTLNDYDDVFRSVSAQAQSLQVPIRYHRLESNQGKRRAQYVAFAEYRADEKVIFVTIDSDTVLDPEAIEKGLYPFGDKRIMSVAGMLYGYNGSGLLTKMLGLSLASSFLNGRSAWSAYGAVAVNCGGLAFYRSQVIDRFLEDYVTQLVFGQPAKYGDDRMLTEYASTMGKTVFQEASVGFTLMPENLGHLTRQRLRWGRSFWWGGFWVLRNHRPNRMIWWLVLSQYVTLLVYLMALVAIAVIYPIMTGRWPWLMLVYMLLLSYVRTMRTLSMKRSDISLGQQIVSYIFLSPLLSLLSVYADTGLRLAALVTLKNGSWGTRSKIEVAANPDGGLRGLRTGGGEQRHAWGDLMGIGVEVPEDQ